MEKLETQNPKIFQFYKENPALNFEEMNLLLIDLLENVMKIKSSTDTSYVVTQLMSKLGSMNEESLRHNGHITQEIEFIKNSLSQSNQTLKILSDFQNGFLTGVRDIFENREFKTIQEISGHLDKHMEIFSSKMKSDLIPSLDSSTQQLLSSSFSKYKTELSSLLSENKEDQPLETLKKDIGERYNSILSTFSGKLSEFELRLTNNLSQNTEQLRETRQLQEKLDGEWNNYMRKQSSSSIKGAQSENQVEHILNKLLPTCEILVTSGIEKSGDFIIKREEKKHILIENKDYAQNVPKKEVDKFLRDVQFHKCHGIFLSQSSGITCRDNFQIQIFEDNILIFMHEVNYNEKTIKIAYDIINHIGERLEDVGEVDEININIPKDVLISINAEYAEYYRHKEATLALIKEYSKKLEENIKKFNLPTLENYLSTKFASVNNSIFKCDICNEFNAKNSRALAAHKKACKKAHLVDVTNPMAKNVILKH